MRIFKALLSLAVVANVAVASSSWLTDAAYNKWHETELERWLSDHNIPYPTPATRRDLHDLVQNNWNNFVVKPYQSWDTDQLTSYLTLKGVDTKDRAEHDKNWLLSQVQATWTETEDKTQHAYNNVKDWILDSWTESQLKSFCDHHGIPVPQPRERDVVLQKARQNYESVAKKMHQTLGYPGNWLYDTWTESDLKNWLDTYGIPAPQPSTRDKLIASVRRNSHLAYLQMQEQSSHLQKAAKKAYDNLSDSVLNTWSDSELKNFCDKNGISVPQGSKANEIRALIRKRRAQVLGDTVSDHFGAATSKVGGQYARATDAASEAARNAFNSAVDTWSESRLKAYLDARGVPVPHKSNTDQLRALVRKNAHQAASGWNAWTFDDLSYENLRDYLQSSGSRAAQKAAEKSGAAREDLVKAAQSYYSSASKAGGTQYASATSYLAKATGSAKKSTFDTWSESDIKAYLDSYGIPVPQGSTLDQLRAHARQQSTYFKYGTTSPTGALYAKTSEALWNSVDWALTQLRIGANAAKKKAETFRHKVYDEL
ncbi:meiotic sister chromatid recombination protein ish1 [Niveomyces insectorum RCEF 264]|uniref:Meiotic sister chromatid recombination protein ish1 n=1 Tax=Niveomyces insectorum RCEF 264 TaxID=1081102 RepID=A0A162J9I1_9HYPO|nr:meiotic sister chromatid recombination protein ish1 [Niveomyces insectorum RCEF 264]